MSLLLRGVINDAIRPDPKLLKRENIKCVEKQISDVIADSIAQYLLKVESNSNIFFRQKIVKDVVFCYDDFSLKHKIYNISIEQRTKYFKHFCNYLENNYFNLPVEIIKIKNIGNSEIFTISYTIDIDKIYKTINKRQYYYSWDVLPSRVSLIHNLGCTSYKNRFKIYRYAMDTFEKKFNNFIIDKCKEHGENIFFEIYMRNVRLSLKFLLNIFEPGVLLSLNSIIKFTLQCFEYDCDFEKNKDNYDLIVTGIPGMNDY